MNISFTKWPFYLIAIFALPSLVFAGDPPMTVGTVNITGEGFFQTETDFVASQSIYFLEVNYDGVAPLTIHTRLTTDAIDTELGLFDASGILETLWLRLKPVSRRQRPEL